MSERSKWELYGGIAILFLGVLSVGLELFSLIVLGEHTEYFDGGWLTALELVFGTFLLARYRSDRFRELSRVIGESVYFRLALALLYLGFGILGAYLAIQAYSDVGEEGATIVLGLGALFAISGFATAGKIVLDSELA
ncbi:hypothetical protein [Halococcus hamelinensis]|uniref:Uncharacterized protein n=1 Tax=Halococcus hamelinensis 100A6 TaxID=1132509 RepID=M0LVS0_9EURY|nr:hypothetical protein [Halococcus hamelinensis]EMA37677.1 hypothetical protein C447_11915 [Halococcus hamelinensis 100A6]